MSEDAASVAALLDGYATARGYAAVVKQEQAECDCEQPNDLSLTALPTGGDDCASLVDDMRHLQTVIADHQPQLDGVVAPLLEQIRQTASVDAFLAVQKQACAAAMPIPTSASADSSLTPVELSSELWTTVDARLTAENVTPFFYEALRNSVRLSAAQLEEQDLGVDVGDDEDCSNYPSVCLDALPQSCRFYATTSADALCADISDCGSFVAYGRADSVVELHRIRDDAPALVDKDQRIDIGPMRLTLNNKMTALSAQNYPNSNEYLQLRGHSGPVYDLRFVDDDQRKPRFVLSCSRDGSVRLFDVRRGGANIFAYRTPYSSPCGAFVWKLDVLRRRQLFATAAGDSLARIYTFERLHPVRTLIGHTGSVDCLRFHPNAKLIVTGSSDGSLKLWSLDCAQPVRSFNLAAFFPQSQCSVTADAVDISRCGRQLAIAGSDGSLSVVDIGTKKPIAVHSPTVVSGAVDGHSGGWLTDRTFSLRFLKAVEHKSLLLAGGADGRIVIGDCDDGGVRLLRSFNVRQASANNLAASVLCAKLLVGDDGDGRKSTLVSAGCL